MLRVAVLFLLAIALSACCTVPPAPVIERTRVVKSDYDTVWKAAVGFASQSAVPVNTLEKDSGLIVFQSFSFGTAEAQFYCPPWGWQPVQNLANGNILVTREGEDTRVTINISYKTMLAQGAVTQWRDAIPTGNLEARMLNAIQSKATAAETLGHGGP